MVAMVELGRSRWSLRGKNFVVTGGSKGIGKAVVRSLLEHEAAIVMFCSRSPCDCETYVTSLGLDFDVVSTNTTKRKRDEGTTTTTATATADVHPPVVMHVVCDVSTEEGRKVLVTAAKEKFGERKLHGLINNVGINVRRPIFEQTEDEYHSMMKTNVDAAYFLCKDLYKASAFDTMNSHEGATIVNVSSAAGVQSSGTGAAYGMSKAALNHFTRILACEWALDNIRVNAVTPWMTMTPMLKEAVAKNPSQLDKVKAWTPMGRLASAEEVADPIVFLCLPASSYVTGQVLGIDGGLTAQGFNGPTCENS